MSRVALRKDQNATADVKDIVTAACTLLRLLPTSTSDGGQKTLPKKVCRFLLFAGPAAPMLLTSETSIHRRSHHESSPNSFCLGLRSVREHRLFIPCQGRMGLLFRRE